VEGSALRLLVEELEEGRIGVVEVEKKDPAHEVSPLGYPLRLGCV
jgi:hypothetical protein